MGRRTENDQCEKKDDKKIIYRSKARMENIFSKYFELTEGNDTVCERIQFQINAYTNGIYPSNYHIENERFYICRTKAFSTSCHIKIKWSRFVKMGTKGKSILKG